MRAKKEVVQFSDYMKQFEKEDSPRGDLARDMRDSPFSMPFLKYREMLRELKYTKMACRESVDTFKECFTEYKKGHVLDLNRIYAFRRRAKKAELSAVDLWYNSWCNKYGIKPCRKM